MRVRGSALSFRKRNLITGAGRTREKEAWEHGKGVTEAVAIGLERTYVT